MPVKLHFNWKDVPRALRFGFSLKKIWVQFLGLLIGTIGYSIFAYLALLASGLSFKEIWNFWKFVPVPVGEPMNVGGIILFILGIIFFIVLNFFFGVAVSKITYEQLKGDDFYEVKEALKFAFKKGKAVIIAPISLIILAVFIIVGGIIVGLLGKIPWFGELVILLSSIPAFFASLFLIYIFFAFILSLFISAAVVATTESDTFDTLFEVFSTLNDENWRFIGYEALLGVVNFIGTSVFIWAIGRAIWIMHRIWAASWLMGDKYVAVEKGALYYMTYSPLFYKIEGWLDFLKVGGILSPVNVLPQMSIPQHILAFVLGILLYFVVFIAIAFPLVVFWVGNTLAYIVLVKKKDDIDLLAQEEKEEAAESLIKEQEEKSKEEEKGEKEEEG